jgi:signal transduction histidine kinase
MHDESADAAERASIEGNELLAGMPGEVRAEIARMAQVTEVAEWEILFDLEDQSDELYLVLSGTIWLGRGEGERKVTFATAGPGDFFGEMSYFSPAPRSARAQALAPAQVARLDRVGIERALELAPATFTRNAMSAFIQRVRASNEDRVREALRQERLQLVGSTVLRIVHDFKNPIHVVTSVASFLEDDIPFDDMPGRLRRAATSMTEMLDELLAFARGDADLRVRPIQLSELMRTVEEQALETMGRRGVEVERDLDPELVVVADPGRLSRALLNIVKNAAEVMPNGGRLALTVRAIAEEVIFSIADTGGGIPEQVLPTLFEPFVTHGKAGGTGLGMSITKTFVEAHGGRIEVQNTPGVGATFVIHLPQPGFGTHRENGGDDT